MPKKTHQADVLKLYRPGEPAQSVKVEGPDGYVGELRHIIDSIQNGKSPPSLPSRTVSIQS